MFTYVVYVMQSHYQSYHYVIIIIPLDKWTADDEVDDK